MRKTLNSHEWCYLCGSTAQNIHEIFYGRNRRLSIKYELMVALCCKCHRFIHDNPKSEQDLKLRELGRDHFEENYPQLDFIEIFK